MSDQKRQAVRVGSAVFSFYGDSGVVEPVFDVDNDAECGSCAEVTLGRGHPAPPKENAGWWGNTDRLGAGCTPWRAYFEGWVEMPRLVLL